MKFIQIGIFLAIGLSIWSASDFSEIVDSEMSYSCDDIIRWISTEKHYSNSKKDILFSLLNKNDCMNTSSILLRNIQFQHTSSGDRKFAKSQSVSKCHSEDEYAVVYLSNYSINNNFSHFLHGLLRLFCALIDAKMLIWDKGAAKFISGGAYTIWLDEYFKLTAEKKVWLQTLGTEIRHLGSLKRGECVSTMKLLYGSGCVRLLPPEKWFGYPGCRAKEILPAFGYYMRQKFSALGEDDLKIIDNLSSQEVGMRISFAVRDVGSETGRRIISNLHAVQNLIKKNQHIRSSMENITFEHLDVPSTVRYMANVHIFVSVHGAGMTNMFFMNPGSAVVEIIPYPLCHCKSPDYFYGTGGYYHGSAIAQGIKHYHYCVPSGDTKWHKKPKDIIEQTNHSMYLNMKCSWKHLHAVESVYLDPNRFVSMMRNVERDLIAMGTIILSKPIINISPHANG